MEAMSELIWLGSYGSTSVDQICERAEVKKGSFYHFFSSKTELALAVIEEASHEVFTTLDRVYSPTVPPLERIRNEALWGYQHQKEISEKFGRVLGCPLFSLGAEVGTREESLVLKIKDILDKHLRYYESALLDAQHQQLIAVTPVAPIARRLLAYAEGMLTQARIHNDLAYIAEIELGFMAMLDLLVRQRA